MAGRLSVEVPSCEGSDSSLSSKPCFAQRCFVLWMQPMSSWHSLLTHYIDMLTHHESHWVCQMMSIYIHQSVESSRKSTDWCNSRQVHRDPGVTSLWPLYAMYMQCICNVCSRDTWVPCFIFDSSLIHLWFIFDSSLTHLWFILIAISISLYHPPLLRIQLGIAFQHHLSPSIPDIDLALISLTTLNRSTVDCLASKIRGISNKIGHVLHVLLTLLLLCSSLTRPLPKPRVSKLAVKPCEPGKRQKQCLADACRVPRPWNGDIRDISWHNDGTLPASLLAAEPRWCCWALEAVLKHKKAATTTATHTVQLQIAWRIFCVARV